MRKTLFALAILFFSHHTWTVPSFPDAEGFGAQATGGRGGRVIHVTHLRARGEGSLQAACDSTGPRIVVFDTSGLIFGHIEIMHGDITLAGQTAPGGSITIRGTLGADNINNAIIRHIRVRRYVSVGEYDGLGFHNCSNIIFDHVTVSWANDENVDLVRSNTITFQWCAVEAARMEGHAKGQHNFGMIIGYPNAYDFSILHCLFAQNQRRAPLIGTSDRDFVIDHRYNVIYNMENGVYWHPDAISSVNMKGDYFKSGPNTQTRNGTTEYTCAIGGIAPTQKVYTEDLYFDWTEGNNDPWTAKAQYGSLVSGNPTHVLTPFTVPATRSYTVQAAYDSVLAHAGCLPRDTPARRVIEEVGTGTGTWGMKDWEKLTTADLMAGLSVYARPLDTDNDGMPDYWENSHGLNPNDNSDHALDRDSDGYTNIEEYINALADTLKVCAVEGRPVTNPGTIEDSYTMQQGDMRIEAYPNPFNHRIGLQLTRYKVKGKRYRVNLKIYNIYGKMVKDFSNSLYLLPSTFYLQAEGLSPGIYIIKLTAGNRTYSKKLFLIK